MPPSANKKPNWLDAGGLHKFEWEAHTDVEKAHARSLLKSGRAVMLHTSIGTYIKKYGSRRPPKLITYEAWSLQLTSKHPDYHKD